MYNKRCMIRTQINLEEQQHRILTIEAKRHHRSLSDLVRESIAKTLTKTGPEKEKKELEVIAKNFVGAGKWNTSHPYWKDKKSVQEWLRKLREEWE